MEEKPGGQEQAAETNPESPSEAPEAEKVAKETNLKPELDSAEPVAVSVSEQAQPTPTENTTETSQPSQIEPKLAEPETPLPQQAAGQLETKTQGSQEGYNAFADGPPLDQQTPPGYFDEEVTDIELPTVAPRVAVVKPLATDFRSDIKPDSISKDASPQVAESGNSDSVSSTPTEPQTAATSTITQPATLGPEAEGPNAGGKNALNSEDWREFVVSLQTELSPGFYSLLKTTVPLKYEGRKLLLACSNVALANPERLQELQGLAADFFGQDYQFQLVEGSKTNETSLIVQEKAEKDQDELDAQEVAKTSPLVKKIQALFEGTEVIAVTPFKENGDV
ncbi:MAG: hypothetical protein QNL04_08655 [SAR324 cluster bacterium]|nr:hypothetical protein [SAR324 cluster bacterium]